MYVKTDGQRTAYVLGDLDNSALARVEADSQASVEPRLRNLSETIWKATAVDGEERAVARGECAPITPGLIIDFGTMTGMVHARLHAGTPAGRRRNP